MKYLSFIFFFLLLSSGWAQLPPVLDQMIQRQEVCGHPEEVGYRLLGRSSVVDAILGDPFYLPTYARLVSAKVKECQTLSDLSTAVLHAGGMPRLSLMRFTEVGEDAPDNFIRHFGLQNGASIFSLWQAFIQIQLEVNATYSVFSEEEKKWLQKHYDDFLFGEDGKSKLAYDFFTSESRTPLHFFQLASRLDYVQLADSFRKLALLVDQAHALRHALQGISLEEDFVQKEQGLTFIVSAKSHVEHRQEADFFLDLGSHNTFYNNAGGTQGVRDVALHISLGGYNRFIGKDFVQGSALLGIGLLACFEGHNCFKAENYSQGAAFFGMGALVNLQGYNRYEIDFAGQSCAIFGTSLVWNRGGFSDYIAHQGLAQSASSTKGIAFLVDETGNSNYLAGVPGREWTRFCGIGQGASMGFRDVSWTQRPSFYGGLSFMYTGAGQNSYSNSWFSQGSSYFLGVGVLVDEGDVAHFQADVDSQGQGLHHAAGLLLKNKGTSSFVGGFGSQGVGADSSVGILLALGDAHTFDATDCAMGTARKPRALGMLIDLNTTSTYSYKNLSLAHLQWPKNPSEWPTALFLTIGGKHTFSQVVEKEWGTAGHSWGMDIEAESKDLVEPLFQKFPQFPRIPFAFDPISGIPSTTSFSPLRVAANDQELAAQISELLHADYERRRFLYECIELYLAIHPNAHADFRPLDLKRLTSVPRLYDMALHNSDVEIRAQAAGRLSQLISEKEIDLVKPLLQDPEERVRYQAAFGLIGRSLQGALELLRPLFSDQSFYVRRAASLAAISMGYKEAIGVLLETLQYETLDTGENYGDNLFQILARYVDVNFGIDKEKWIAWWSQQTSS